MRLLKAGLYALLVLLLAVPAGAEPFAINGKPVPPQVASVNGVDLDARLLISEIKVYQLMKRQKNQTVSDKELAEYSKQALSRLVEQELIYQKAQAMRIQPDPKLLDQKIEEIRKQFPSEKLFQAALKMQGLTLDLLKTKFRKQWVEEEIIRREIAPRVKVEEAEVAAYYESKKREFTTPEKYELYHIFTAALMKDPHAKYDKPADKKKAERLNRLIDLDAKEKIKDLRGQLRRGGDFAALAKEHSEDEATRPKGGLWGQVALKDLPPKMAEAVRGLKQNEVGEPFRSRYGYHLFKWTKKIPAGHVPLSEVKTDIMNLLLREKTLTEHRKMVGQLRKKARIQLFY